MRPDRRDEAPRFGSLGRVRQWIEAIFDQLKDQLSLERHGAHMPQSLWARVLQRLLALGACVWHNWRLWEARRARWSRSQPRRLRPLRGMGISDLDD